MIDLIVFPIDQSADVLPVDPVVVDGPELIKGEMFSPSAQPGLLENNRTGGSELDGQGGDQHQRRESTRAVKAPKRSSRRFRAN